jgi:hypothetical protein
LVTSKALDENRNPIYSGLVLQKRVQVNTLKKAVFILLCSYSVVMTTYIFVIKKDGEFLAKRWDMVTCCYSTGDGAENTRTAIVAQSCRFDSQKPFRSAGYDCYMIRVFGGQKIESLVFRKGRDKVLGKLTVIPLWWNDYKEALYYQ